MCDCSGFALSGILLPLSRFSRALYVFIFVSPTIYYILLCTLFYTVHSLLFFFSVTSFPDSRAEFTFLSAGFSPVRRRIENINTLHCKWISRIHVFRLVWIYRVRFCLLFIVIIIYVYQTILKK